MDSGTVFPLLLILIGFPFSSFSSILPVFVQWTKLVTSHRLSVCCIFLTASRRTYGQIAVCINWLIRLLGPVLVLLWLRKQFTWLLIAVTPRVRPVNSTSVLCWFVVRIAKWPLYLGQLRLSVRKFYKLTVTVGLLMLRYWHTATPALRICCRRAMYSALSCSLRSAVYSTAALSCSPHPM